MAKIRGRRDFCLKAYFNNIKIRSILVQIVVFSEKELMSKILYGSIYEFFFIFQRKRPLLFKRAIPCILIVEPSFWFRMKDLDLINLSKFEEKNYEV